MRPVQVNLIRTLLQNDTSLTSSQLAKILNVSIRSVKTYIHDINQEYPELIKATKKGYDLNRTMVSTVLNASNHIPQCSKERVVYIINTLIQATRPIHLLDLSEAMFISSSTLKLELQKVKRKIGKYDLQLQITTNYGSIIGLEKNKRKLLSSILYEESNINFVNMKVLQENFGNIDIIFLKETILNIFAKYQYFINDYALIDLLLHITIAIDRIRNHNINDTIQTNVKKIPENELKVAKDIALKLEAHFHIKYTEGEIYELALLLISRATIINYQKLDENNLEQYIEVEYINLVKDLLAEVNRCYYIDFNDMEFFVRFTLHIRSLIIRSQHNYFSKNPLSKGVKTSCPMIYEIAIRIADLIQQYTKIQLNEDEIAYITFHLGSALETQKTKNTKIKACLYCPSYYDISIRLVEAINHYFENDIVITNIYTDESEVLYISTDLIIATIPIGGIPTAPMIQISIFLNDLDIQLLKTKINTIAIQKKQAKFKKNLNKLMVPELFQINPMVSTLEETIPYMVDLLIKHQYVDETFLKEVLEREKMASTAYGAFAIPHAMIMQAKKTALNVVISERPIDWNGVSVHLIIMLCFNQNERYLFNEIFEPITLILNNPDNIKQLLSCKNYEDFINMMVMMMK